MTYTHHFILQSICGDAVTRDTFETMPHNRVLTSEIEEVESHWGSQYGTRMIVINVYVTEEL